MRPITLTQTGVGQSDPARLNFKSEDFKVGLGATVDGTVTYTIQHTFDDPKDFTSKANYNSNANWFDHDQLAGLSANANGNYEFPIQATRINVTSGTGTVTLVILQGR